MDNRSELNQFCAEVKQKASVKAVLELAFGGTIPGAGQGKTHCLDKGCGGTDTAHIYEPSDKRPGSLQCFKCNNEFKRLEMKAANLSVAADKSPNVDVFDILQRAGGYDFKRACEALSKLTGIPLPKRRELTAEEKEELVRIGKIKDVLKKAADFYFFNIVDEAAFQAGQVKNSEKPAREAKAYLMSRDVKVDSITDFKIGATTSEGLRSVFPDYDTNPFLLAAGLVRLSTDGLSRFDFFRNRIMFPFMDKDGAVIGFSGRSLESDSKQKYINTSSTELFKKGGELFGFYQARKHIIETGRALFVEGQMDVVKCHFHHVKEAIASSGTAVTASQLETVFKLCDEAVFCFDGDYAGYAAAYRACATAAGLIDSRRKVSLMFSPGGKDPDEFFSLKGEDAKLPNDQKQKIRMDRLMEFRSHFDKRQPLHQVLVDLTAHKLRGADNFDPEYKFSEETDVHFIAGVMDEIRDMLASFRDDIYRATLTRSIEVQMGLAPGFLGEKVELMNTEHKRPTINHVDIGNGKTDVAVDAVLTACAMMLVSTEAVERLKPLVAEINRYTIETQETRFLLALHQKLLEDPEMDAQSLILTFKGTEFQDLLLRVGDASLSIEYPVPEQDLMRGLDKARLQAYQAKINSFHKMGSSDPDEYENMIRPVFEKSLEIKRSIANRRPQMVSNGI